MRRRIWGRGVPSTVGLACAAILLLAACNPKDKPVQLGAFPGHDVVSSMSASGRWVLIGTQNRPTDSGAGQLILVDRDVDASGTLDTSGNTSTTVLLGAGGWTTNIDRIDNAKAFTPAISADGSLIAFEAYDPNASGDHAWQRDCLYWTHTSTLLAQSGSIRYDPPSCSGDTIIHRADWMNPQFSDDGKYLAYTTWRPVTQGSTTVGCPVVRLIDTVAETVNEVSTTYDGQVPSLGLDCGQSYVTDISGDGRFVIFQSTDPLTADQIGSGQSQVPLQVFSYDRLTGKTTDLSALTNGDESSAASGGSVSPDGRFAAFCSESDTLVPDSQAKGPHCRVYVLDRDTTGSTDSNGNLVVDQTNTAVVAATDGSTNPVYTQVGASSNDGSGNVHVGPVAWSETGVGTGAGAQAMARTRSGSGIASTESAGRGVGTVKSSGGDGASHLSDGITGADGSPTTSSTTTSPPEPSSTMPTPSTVTTTSVPAESTSTSVPAGSTTTSLPSVTSLSPSAAAAPGDQVGRDPASSPSGDMGPAWVNDIALSLGSSRQSPAGQPMRTGAAMVQSSATTVGGDLTQIEVANMQTGQVTVTSNSGDVSPTRYDNFGLRFDMSEQGNEVAYSVLDSTGADSALARAVVFPKVTHLASTLGFRPFGAYVSDPVNAATGSFTNQNTDIPAQSGVWGIDWTGATIRPIRSRGCWEPDGSRHFLRQSIRNQEVRWSGMTTAVR